MKQDTREIILELIRGAGLISLALLLPGSCDAIKQIRKIKKFSRKNKYYVNSVIKKMINEGLLEEDKGGFVSLSLSGRAYLENLDGILKPAKWDGKYRIIIFDIPEEKRGSRNLIRQQLVNWGFVKLQNSVWVHPYECQRVATLLKMKFHFIGEVLYLTAESIENDSRLKKEFGLI